MFVGGLKRLTVDAGGVVMSLKMRDLPRLTVSILFCHNKKHDLAEAARLWATCEDYTLEPELNVKLNNALRDCYHNPKNRYKVCKILLPKLNAKLRKLQDEGMYIVGLTYDETLVDGSYDPPSIEAIRAHNYRTIALLDKEDHIPIEEIPVESMLESQAVSINEIENPNPEDQYFDYDKVHNIE